MRRRHFLSALASSAALATTEGLSAAAPYGRLSEEFLRAVRAGDLALVRSMLSTDGSLVYARDVGGRSAYVLAHLHGQPRVAEHLAAQGFLMDVVEATLAQDWERVDEIGATSPGVFNADHPYGGTSMLAAARVGVGRDLWRLQQYGADPNGNPRGDRGITPVRAAVEHDDPVLALETTATLLGNGGDANRQQRGRSSVLHGAAATGNTELIRLVVRKGADLEARDDAGRTPLEVAMALGHEEAARLLRNADGIRKDHRTSRFAYAADGSTYQPAELEGYDPALVNRLVGASHFDLDTATSITDRFPALVSAVSYLDEGAVEAAAHTGRAPVVTLLLERGAPYSLPTAGTMGDLEWAKRLLAEDPRRVDERGAHDFAMMWYPAIGGESLDIAELLLEHGAEIDQEHLGTTGLHFAVRAGHEQLTELLLQRGADPDAVGQKFRRGGETPLDHAAAADGGRITDILLAAGASRRITSGE